LSFKFIAIAYGMLGATAATGYMVQGGGGSGAVGKRPSGQVAEQPKVERVAKLEMPAKPGAMPQVAMVASSPQDESVVMTAPVAMPSATPSATPLTAPPTPAPPPPPREAMLETKPAVAPVEQVAEKQAEKPVEKIAEKTPEKPVDRGGSRDYVRITAEMMVNPWTGEWLTSDDRSMGYVSGPAKGMAPAAAPERVMVADAQPAAAVEPPATTASAPPAPPTPDPAPVSIPVTIPVPVKAASQPAVRHAAAQPVPQPAPQSTAQQTGQQHGYMAHLASYRDEIHAAAGWKTLQKAHRDLLINRSPVTVTAEIPGQGTFVRLMAGGFGQLADVSEFCSEFKASGQYCIPVKAK
jgi:hypothetical protein